MELIDLRCRRTERKSPGALRGSTSTDGHCARINDDPRRRRELLYVAYIPGVGRTQLRYHPSNPRHAAPAPNSAHRRLAWLCSFATQFWRCTEISDWGVDFIEVVLSARLQAILNNCVLRDPVRQPILAMIVGPQRHHQAGSRARHRYETVAWAGEFHWRRTPLAAEVPPRLPYLAINRGRHSVLPKRPGGRTDRACTARHTPLVSPSHLS